MVSDMPKAELHEVQTPSAPELLSAGVKILGCCSGQERCFRYLRNFLKIENADWTQILLFKPDATIKDLG